MSGNGFWTPIEWAERGWLPDALTRPGIRGLVRAGLRARGRLSTAAQEERQRRLLEELRSGPIAVQTAAANEQHYELPPEFFGLVLGKRRKYSGCYWPAGVRTLDEAEDASLRETCAHADVRDGQDILELGCGWGSLTLWLAEHYPASRIVAVSNSHAQRRFLEEQCRARGLNRVRIITADMNEFQPDATFDRVVSVEMFEHMRNHERLMSRIAGWLRPGGRLFVHCFVHGRETYLFETAGAGDWMSRYFFSGGVMPAERWLLNFQQELALEEQWRQDGTHYQKTAEAWLKNLDAQREAVLEILRQVYGPAQHRRWLQRWRLFFLACAELFGYAGGSEWWVAHYRFARRAAR